MWFVNPAFLWAFGLLAIPVLIHLFHFRRYKRVYFPSLKTLKELNREKKSIKSLKKWVILVLRLLAFASLVLAFAQPFFLKDQQKSVSGISVVSIYIDNSFSMSAKGMEGSLFNESKELARKLIEKRPEDVIRFAVKGMLPKGPLGYAMIKKLKVYADQQHPHTAQQPKTLEI